MEIDVRKQEKADISMVGLRNAKDYDDGFVSSWMAKGKTVMYKKIGAQVTYQVVIDL